MAVRGGYLGICRLLLAAGAELLPQCIHDAVEGGEEEILLALLEHRSIQPIHLNTPAGKYGTPLQAALLSPKTRPSFFRTLLHHGADIYAKGSEF